MDLIGPGKLQPRTRGMSVKRLGEKGFLQKKENQEVKKT